MAYARDVAVSLQDGSLHDVRFDAPGPNVAFDNGLTRQASRNILSGRLAVDGRGVQYAVAASHEANEHVLLDSIGSPEVVLQGGGRFAMAIRPMPVGVEVFAQGGNEDGENTTIRVFDEFGNVKRTFAAKYGSMGILAVTGPGSILSSADPSTFRQVGGVQGWTVLTVNGWTLMQTEDNPPNGGLRLTAPTGEQWTAKTTPTWNGYTNMPSYLAVGVSDVRVAILDATGSLSAPAPDDIEWEPIGHSRTVASLFAAQPPVVVPPFSSGSPLAQTFANNPDDIVGLAILGALLAAALYLEE